MSITAGMVLMGSAITAGALAAFWLIFQIADWRAAEARRRKWSAEAAEAEAQEYAGSCWRKNEAR